MGIKLSMIKILLLIFILITILPALLFAADGFGVNADGGAAGINVNVTNATDFTTYANSPLPYIITVSGTIILSGNLNITSNKTIQGADSNATVIGNLKIGNDSRNVIVQNLNITNPGGVGDGDGITIQGAKNIFITHCTFTDCADGSVDIVNQADSVTISWCKFRYIQQTSHCYINLIGNSDSSTDDLGYLHVTIHHCWYDTNCVERMPSVRFGRVHVYNNYYHADSIKYGVRTRLYAECLVENNYFENMKNPWELLTTSGTTGKLYASKNNISFMDTAFRISWISGWYPGQSLIAGDDVVFSPPYSYISDNFEDVKTNVINYAGNKGSLTRVEVSQSEPSSFVLYQNYPNPFNPSTNIHCTIPKNGFVSIKVYDVLGNEIATLLNGFKNQGNYKIVFDGNKLSSGIYFYSLVFDNNIITKKMSLLK